jgi:hypothetical protein
MFVSPDVLSLLLTHGAKIEHRSARWTKRPYIGRLDSIKLLLDKNAAINAIPDDENIPNLVRQNDVGTALHDAAEGRQGRCSAIDCWRERGSTSCLETVQGQTAKEVATKNEWAKLLE